MAQQQGQSQGDATSSFFWYVVLLALAVILIWIFGKEYIIPPFFTWRRIEIHALEHILSAWNTLTSYVHLKPVDFSDLQSVDYYIDQTAANNVAVEQVKIMSHVVGSYYRYVVIGGLVVMAYITGFRHRVAQFSQDYDMNSLKKAEVANWPQITPVLDLDLAKQDLDTGPWAMSKLPMDFCKEHQLLRIIEEKGQKRWGVVAGAAERQFVLQMGPLWQGVDALPLHAQALLVIFVTRITHEQKISFDLLDQLAKSSRHGQLDFTGVSELVQKYKNHPVIKWAAERHAYVFTVLASLLEIARLEGVLASAEFLWLKPLDRRLWYVMNTVGRTTAVVEVAGVFAHWLAEKKLRRRLTTPVVEEAVNALDQAVSEILYIPEGASWRMNSAA